MFTLEDPVRKSVENTFRAIASANQTESATAARNLAEAVEGPIRKVLLSGDITGNIFTPEDFTDGRPPEYTLDLLTPGQEDEYYAYVCPSHGMIPYRRVEADYLMVPTFEIANSIDCTQRFIKNANWAVINRMLEVLNAGFVKKINDDAWQTIIAAAVDRNILINDPNAAAGQFTPRLVTLLKTFMRRNGGGNSTTLNRSRLTDLYVSPEAQDDIRSWGLDLIPDAVREAIWYSDDEGTDVIRVYGVNIHALDELGEGQEYQQYFTTTLGGSMAAGDVEIAIGLDLTRRDSFVMPIAENLVIREDNTVDRRGLFSLYGKMRHGFCVLDTRRTILASL